MDKIKINFISLGDMRGYTSFAYPYTSLCGRDEDGLCQLDGWATCRETVVGYVRGKYRPDPYNEKCARLTTDKIRVLTYLKQTMKPKALREEKRLAFEAALKNAVKILNFFEKMSRLKLSKLYQVEHSLPASHFIYLIEGSAEWQRAPSLLSLYLLLIRCGRFLELGKFATLEEFVERCTYVIKDFEKNTKGYSYSEKRSYPSAFPIGNGNDTSHLRLIANKIPIIMKNRRKLFSKTTAEGHFKDCNSIDGISKLCHGEIKNKELSKHFVEMCDSYEIEADKPFM